MLLSFAANSNVRLFLRTTSRAAGGAAMPYTYLGRLEYLTHDTERERPVYFQWQLIDDWPPLESVLTRIGLQPSDETPRLGVNAKHVVHSGDSGNNGGYHTNPLPLEGPPNEISW